MSIKRVFNKRNFSVLFLIIAVGWIVQYAIEHQDEFKDIRLLSFQDVIILLCFALLGILLRGLFTKLLVESFDVKLKFKQWFGIMVITTMGNYMVPFGGIGLRATYLKKFHNFPYAYFLSTMMATYVIQFLIYSVLGLVCLLYVYLRYNIFNIVVCIFFVVVTLFCLALMLFSVKLPQFKTKVFRHINRVIDGWLKLKKARKLIVRVSALLLLKTFVFAFGLYFAFSVFNYQIYLPWAILITCLVGFTLLLRITPGSLGIQEGVFVLSSQLFGFTVAQGLLVAVLIRVISLIWVFTLGPLFSYLLMKESNLSKKEPEDCL